VPAEIPFDGVEAQLRARIASEALPRRLASGLDVLRRVIEQVGQSTRRLEASSDALVAAIEQQVAELVDARVASVAREHAGSGAAASRAADEAAPTGVAPAAEAAAESAPSRVDGALQEPNVATPVVETPAAGAPAAEKPADAKPADAKPAEEKPADAAPSENGGPFEGGFGGGGRRGEEREEKLTWQEKRDWRMNGSVRLTGRTSAWYLHRTFAPTEARDVVLRHSGLDGLKIWIDGVVVFEKAPVAPTEEEDEEQKSGPGGDEDDEGMDFGGFEREEVAEFETFTFRLEPGEHEFVAKVVTSRTGARGTLQFLPLGRDVMPYEVQSALASRAADEAAIASGEARGATDEPISDFSFDDDDSAKLSTPEARRTWVREWFRRQVSEEGRARWDELTALRQEKSAMERKLPSVMVMADREQPRETHVLLRGNYNTKGQRVEAGVPSVLPPLPEGASNDRVGLAHWIASESNPLTARVAVNRFWQQHFGRPLVSTPGDFGTRGALPSHPELLDWLAAEFVASGWDMKAMHRLIVTSNTYRQSSRIRPEHLEIDPDNLLLARAPRGRLSAEQVRDNALAVAGLLSPDVGGKSVKPYQPKGLWEAQGAFQSYKQDKGDALYRRGIYVYWKRSTLYPSFEAFDAPSRLTCVVERAKTTTPLQSLVLLNDPVYVEAARFLGQRMLLEGGKDVSSRLVFGFRLCTSRLPSDEELGILLRIHAEQAGLFAADETAAKELVAVGDGKPDPNLRIQDLATWTVMGSVLLNLDATIHKR